MYDYDHYIKNFHLVRKEDQVYIHTLEDDPYRSLIYIIELTNKKVKYLDIYIPFSTDKPTMKYNEDEITKKKLSNKRILSRSVVPISKHYAIKHVLGM